MLTNIRNDRLKFAVLQQYPGDMFEKILGHYENYRYTVGHLGLDRTLE